MDERIALVTGGARGIGAAIVARLRRSGATVIVADLEPTHPDHLELDVSDETAATAAVQAIAQRFGRLDILVNNAGINLRATARQTTLSEWNRLFAVNVGGTFTMSRLCYPRLAAASGCVVNLASTAGLVGITGTAAYGSSKAAIIGLTRALATEWAADGIRVNAVAPTLVETGMTADVLADPDYVTAKLATVPLRRFPTADEVAGTVAYLCSADAAGVTGQTLPIDGGVTIAR